MALFGNDKPGWSPDEEERFNFFSDTEATYTMPSSRKPVVVKIDKVTKKLVEKKRTSPKKSATKKSVKVVNAATTAEKAVKKAVKAAAAEAQKRAAEKALAEKAAKKSTASTEKKKTATATKVAAKNAVSTATKAMKKSEQINAVDKKIAKSKPDTKKTATKKAADSEIATVETVTAINTARNGSFDVKKSKDGRFVFNLYAANGVIIATSQAYSSAQRAMTGIKSVMTNAATSEIEDLTLKKPVTRAYPKWEIYIDRAGEYRFRLHATNANCICHAKAGYATKASCKRGIESIIRLAEDAEIKKRYLKK